MQWAQKLPCERVADSSSHPWNQTVTAGGITDVWYLDDGTAFMHPALALEYLKSYDVQTRAR
eukprot:536576-Karenia_brevis.AAC.1